MSRLLALLLASVFLVYPSFGRDDAGIPQGIDFPASATELEAMRSEGNLEKQRDHVWQVFSGVTRTAKDSTIPVFLTWYGAGEVFAKSSEGSFPGARGVLQSFSLPGARKNFPASSRAAPLIVRAHYNAAAYGNIRDNGLEDAAQLGASATLPKVSAKSSEFLSIPAFPRPAIVVKTVWWPIPEQGVVALPVWDPASNPPRATGNDYLTWSRMVGISAQPGFGVGTTKVDVDFMGRSFRHVRAVGIDALYHVTLDKEMAESLMLDPETRKVAGLVLGRALHAHDMVALVALHLATRELEDWVWGTFWWHDRPGQGPFAQPAKPLLGQPWRNYLMSVSFDSDLPREADGSPHVAFNPWLEARFPDGGRGGGVVSNCVTCHRRASTTADAPFLVTRGHDDSQGRAASEKGAVRTSSLWSLPLQAR